MYFGFGPPYEGQFMNEENRRVSVGRGVIVLTRVVRVRYKDYFYKGDIRITFITCLLSGKGNTFYPHCDFGVSKDLFDRVTTQGEYLGSQYHSSLLTPQMFKEIIFESRHL